MTRVVVDVGNSRIKLGTLGLDGSLKATTAVSVDQPDAWHDGIARMGVELSGPTNWTISTVNPPVSQALAAMLGMQAQITILRSASEVPVPHKLTSPQTTGADRALAVLAALARFERRGPGQVISCGTALTVERIDADGVWSGGAIAPGLSTMAAALNVSTAQLPLVAADAPPPDGCGDATGSALAAGIFWGAVGVIREISTRQFASFDRSPWRVWTGGDAPRFSTLLDGPEALLVPELVLEGLALWTRHLANQKPE